jgi:hypothetical protein
MICSDVWEHKMMPGRLQDPPLTHSSRHALCIELFARLAVVSADLRRMTGMVRAISSGGSLVV